MKLEGQYIISSWFQNILIKAKKPFDIASIRYKFWILASKTLHRVASTYTFSLLFYLLLRNRSSLFSIKLSSLVHAITCYVISFLLLRVSLPFRVYIRCYLLHEPIPKYPWPNVVSFPSLDLQVTMYLCFLDLLYFSFCLVVCLSVLVKTMSRVVSSGWQGYILSHFGSPQGPQSACDRCSRNAWI